MAMGAPTATNMSRRPMTIDPKTLTLMQWLSPSFPLGSFAYSHGLETAVSQGLVSDAASLTDWLSDVLEHGTGRSDAIWLRLAYASDDLPALNAEATAFQLSRERLREAERQGAAFVSVVNEVWSLNLPPLLLPLAVGAAAKAQNMQVDLVAALYLQSFLANLVAAAQRLIGLGQTQAQQVVASLQPICSEVAADSTARTIDDIHASAFLSDIMAMRHETLQPRLFQS